MKHSGLFTVPVFLLAFAGFFVSLTVQSSDERNKEAKPKPLKSMGWSPLHHGHIGQSSEDSIKAITNLMLSTLTGPVGKERDWEAVKANFTPDAQFAVNGAKGVRVINSNWFFAKGDSLYKSVDFKEEETSFRCDIKGSIATVYQGYKCMVNGKPSHSGYNVYVLLHRPGGKWLVSHLTWDVVPATKPKN